MNPADLVPITINSPVRRALLSAVFDAATLGLQPATEKSDVAIVPDGTLGLFNSIDITSSSYTEIRPTLSVTFTHDTPKLICAILHVAVVVTTTSSVAEFGIEMDGVDFTDSMVRVSSSAAASGGSLLATSYMFILGAAPGVSDPVPAGTHTIKPVARTISGASPNIRFRFTRGARFIVRDM